MFCLDSVVHECNSLFIFLFSPEIAPTATWDRNKQYNARNVKKEFKEQLLPPTDLTAPTRTLLVPHLLCYKRCYLCLRQACGGFVQTLTYLQFTKTCCTVLSIARQMLRYDFETWSQYVAVTQLSFLPCCRQHGQFVIQSVIKLKKWARKIDKPCKKEHIFLAFVNRCSLIVDSIS